MIGALGNGVNPKSESIQRYMKDQLTVFYTASYYGKDKYQEYYSLVTQTLETFKVHLISPEVGNYELVLSKAEQKEIRDPKLRHYFAIKQGIHMADAVIIEVSHEDIQLGHEATLALFEKKPVLCLSLHEDFSKKIKHDYFFASRYTKMNLQSVIQNFLSRVRELSLSKRFNLFLYPRQLEYLEKAGKKEGMNMSEYIRHLINRDKLANQ